MKLKDSFENAINEIANMFSFGFMIFIFGVMLPLIIGLLICATICCWLVFNGFYIISILFIFVGVFWFFFWLNFTEDWGMN
jgi:uncharacterized membrane protein